jgi:hypothetical protein
MQNSSTARNSEFTAFQMTPSVDAGPRRPGGSAWYARKRAPWEARPTGPRWIAWKNGPAWSAWSAWIHGSSWHRWKTWVQRQARPHRKARPRWRHGPHGTSWQAWRARSRRYSGSKWETGQKWVRRCVAAGDAHATSSTSSPTGAENNNISAGSSNNNISSSCPCCNSCSFSSAPQAGTQSLRAHGKVAQDSGFCVVQSSHSSANSGHAS